MFVGHWAAGNARRKTAEGAGRSPRISRYPTRRWRTVPASRRPRSRVVKILGSAPECNWSIEGSGFVYAPQHVITAAHDIAGVSRADGDHGRWRDLQRQGRLLRPADRHRGARCAWPERGPAAVQHAGQPRARRGGGRHPGAPGVHGSAARIRRGAKDRERQTSISTGHIDRQVYKIRGVVQPGDSGGPLLSPSRDRRRRGGQHRGEVRAPDGGWALTIPQIQSDVKAAASATAPVSTQGCLGGG